MVNTGENRTYDQCNHNTYLISILTLYNWASSPLHVQVIRPTICMFWVARQTSHRLSTSKLEGTRDTLLVMLCEFKSLNTCPTYIACGPWLLSRATHWHLHLPITIHATSIETLLQPSQRDIFPHKVQLLLLLLLFYFIPLWTHLELLQARNTTKETIKENKVLRIYPGQSGTAGTHSGMPLAGHAAVVVRWRTYNILMSFTVFNACSIAMSQGCPGFSLFSFCYIRCHVEACSFSCAWVCSASIKSFTFCWQGQLRVLLPKCLPSKFMHVLFGAHNYI